MIDQLTQEDLTQQIRCVSHEIRNHLSICDMYSQIIKRNLEKSNIENESITNALDCIQKSLQIIDSNLLELKSLNTNTQHIVDFQALIQKGCDLAKAYIIDKEINFEIFIKNTDNVLVDENKFLACLVNIIKNGIEAIETRGEIEVLAEIKADTGIIRISNNGKPIPKEKQETIFKQGYTTKKTGSGIGLALCKKYLNCENSQISLLKSSKNKTTFEIQIPTYKV